VAGKPHRLLYPPGSRQCHDFKLWYSDVVTMQPSVGDDHKKDSSSASVLHHHKAAPQSLTIVPFFKHRGTFTQINYPVEIMHPI
jgi:hypothetical protein